jgi:hypothetical protein
MEAVIWTEVVQGIIKTLGVVLFYDSSPVGLKRRDRYSDNKLVLKLLA